MGSEIVSLESKRKNRASSIYNHTHETIDYLTGEVSCVVHSFVKKEKSKDDFVKLFVENVDFIETLGEYEMKILIYAIRMINYTNSFVYTTEFLDYFVSKKIMSKSTFYENFNCLIRKKVLIEATREAKEQFGLFGKKIYFIHPDIVGKGSFLDLKNVKQTITKEFDFNTLELKKTVTTEESYGGLEEIVQNANNKQIESVETEILNDGKKIQHNIIISDKENSDNVIDVISNEDIENFKDDNSTPSYADAILTNKKDIEEVLIEINSKIVAYEYKSKLEVLNMLSLFFYALDYLKLSLKQRLDITDKYRQLEVVKNGTIERYFEAE